MATGIRIVIETDDKSSKVIAGVHNKFMKFDRAVTGGARNIVSGFRKIGSGMGKLTAMVSRMAMVAKLALVAAAGYAVMVGVKFEQAIANVASVAGGGADAMRELAQTARYWGQQSIYSASQAAEGMYALASAGQSVAQIKESIGGTLIYAAATGADMAMATETVVQSLKMFGLEAEKTNAVVNVLAAGISASMLNASRLKESLAEVGASAHAAGMSLEQTVGTLGLLHNAGMLGSVAGTRLKNVLVRLAKPNADMRKLMGDVAFEGNNLGEVMESMTGKANDLAVVYGAFGRIAGPAALVMIQAGAKGMKEMEDRVTATQKAFEMYKTQTATVMAQSKILRSVLEETFIATFTEIRPLLSSALTALTNGLKRAKPYIVAVAITIRNWINDNKDLIKTTFKIMAVLAGVLVIVKVGITVFGILSTVITIVAGAVQVLIGAVTIFGSVFATVLAGLFSPLGLVVLAIGAIVAVFYVATKSVWDSTKSLTDNLKAVFKKVFEYIKNGAEWVGKRLKAPFALSIMWIYDKLLWLAEKIGFLLDKIIPGFSDSIKSMRGDVAVDIAAAAADITAQWDGAIEFVKTKTGEIGGKAKSTFSNVQTYIGGVVDKFKSMGKAASDIDLGGVTLEQLMAGGGETTFTPEQKAALAVQLEAIQTRANAEDAALLRTTTMAQQHTREWLDAKNQMIEIQLQSELAAAGENTLKIAEAEMKAYQERQQSAGDHARSLMEYNDMVIGHYMATHELQMAALYALEAGYDEFYYSLWDKEMTAMERWQNMVQSMKDTFLRATGDMIKQYIKNKLKSILLAAAAEKAANKQSRFAEAKLGAIASYRAFAAVPIIGPILGAAAAAAAFAFLMAFHKGGLIPGMQTNERIVRVMPGEYIVQPAAVQSVGVPAMDYINATGRIPPQAGPSNTYILQFNQSEYDDDELAERARDQLVPVLEELFGSGALRLEKI